MAYSAKLLSDRWKDAWNAFVDSANGGTLFHRLDFLAYHGRRFSGNEHHLVILKGDSLFGVMPMGIFPQSGGPSAARSPYGASCGGPLFAEPLTYSAGREIAAAIVAYLGDQGVGQLAMTLPISPYYRTYSETFRLALMEEGFACTNRDISSVVPLEGDRSIEQIVSSRARNMSRKAVKADVRIVAHAPLEDFWKVMDATFSKHGTNPTHTLDEFRCLHETFPRRIWVDVGYLGQTPVAGVGYFAINERVNSSFYLCQDPAHQDCQAQSLLICHALSESRKAGYGWFDFGTSSVNMQGRENIFRFKESFGAAGVFRETYTWRDDSEGQ